MAPTANGYPYPVAADPNDTPADIKALADAVEATLGVLRFRGYGATEPTTDLQAGDVFFKTS